METRSAMDEDRMGAVAAVLRQLSVGLSAYRLFPGALEQPAFVGATRRIAGAAETALADGPVDVEVRGGIFATVHGPIDADEITDKLARVCYERRAERLRIRAVPTAGDLAVLYEVLSAQPADVAAAGGPAAMLRRSGVVNVALGELTPHALEVVGAKPEDRVPEGPPGWSIDPRELEEDPAETKKTPREAAEYLFRRFKTIVASLPEEVASNIELYKRLQLMVAALPPERRRLLHALLLERAGEDEVAGRYIGTMSDSELARMLVDLGRDGNLDPVKLAGELDAVGLGRDDLATLTAAVAEGREEPVTVMAEVDGSAETGTWNQPLVYQTVSDLLAQEHRGVEHADVQALRESFPRTEEEERDVALATVADYLRLEPDPERLDRVLELWTAEARAALRRADGAALPRLLEAFDRAKADTEDRERRMLFDVYRRQVTEPFAVRELIGATSEGGDAPETLLEPFLPEVLGTLMDLLANEDDGPTRTAIMGTAAKLAPAHLNRVAARLSSGEWQEARDAVALLYRAGGPEVIRWLEQASRHGHPGVRLEAVWGLISVGGSGAAPALARLALDPEVGVRTLALGGLGGLTSSTAVVGLAQVARTSSDLAIRRAALEQLGRHPLAEAGWALRELAGRRRPRLPRSLRRVAKALARRHQAVQA